MMRTPLVHVHPFPSNPSASLYFSVKNLLCDVHIVLLNYLNMFTVHAISCHAVQHRFQENTTCLLVLCRSDSLVVLIRE